MQTNTVKINGQAVLQKKRMQNRFNKALGVMMDLRSQPGIIDPTKAKMFYTVDLKKGQGVGVGRHFYSTGQILGPAYSSVEDVDKAIQAVGINRITEAFETLMFIGH